MVIAQDPWCPPVIRWAGSKRKLLPILISASPPVFRRYFEPFVGSGCLFFALKPKRAVLGDINEELVSALQALRQHPRLLHRRAAAFGLNRRKYYELRDHPKSIDGITGEAARFIALNRYCFNGLYRANRSGKFNVPFGTRTGALPAESIFYRAAIALRNAKIVQGDFAETVRTARRGDYVYLDPPYVYSGRRDRGEYGPNTFSVDDVERLFVTMRRLTERGAYVLLSFIECDEVLRRARGWTVRRVPVQRQISAFAQYRIRVNEVLISNYEFQL